MITSRASDERCQVDWSPTLLPLNLRRCQSQAAQVELRLLRRAAATAAAAAAVAAAAMVVVVVGRGGDLAMVVVVGLLRRRRWNRGRLLRRRRHGVVRRKGHGMYAASATSGALLLLLLLVVEVDDRLQLGHDALDPSQLRRSDRLLRWLLPAEVTEAEEGRGGVDTRRHADHRSALIPPCSRSSLFSLDYSPDGGRPVRRDPQLRQCRHWECNGRHEEQELAKQPDVELVGEDPRVLCSPKVPDSCAKIW